MVNDFTHSSQVLITELVLMCWWLWLFRRAVHARTLCKWIFSLADIRTTITGTAVRQSLRLPRRHRSLRVAAWLMNYHHINCWGTCTFPPHTSEVPPHPPPHTDLRALLRPRRRRSKPLMNTKTHGAHGQQQRTGLSGLSLFDGGPPSFGCSM